MSDIKIKSMMKLWSLCETCGREFEVTFLRHDVSENEDGKVMHQVYTVPAVSAIRHALAKCAHPEPHRSLDVADADAMESVLGADVASLDRAV